MNIPKTIKILGHTFTVSEVSDKELDKEDCKKGMYDWHKGVIKLDKDLRQDEKEEVFFHEICEALAHYLGLSYHETSTHDGFDKYHSLLWAVLKDNKII